MTTSGLRHETTKESAEALVASRPWWYHRFEIFPGVVTPGVYDPSGTLAALNLPPDMSGMRVLEIGPADGYFTKHMTLRGAKVTAADYMPKDFCGFAVMEELHGAPLEFIQSNIYDLPRLALQPYDLVICLGVLYHLPDMLRALHILRPLCSGQMILETLVAMDLGSEPLARYHSGRTLNDDPTNFWSPNVVCISQMLGDAGWTLDRDQVLSHDATSGRAAFWCRPTPNLDGTSKTDLAYSGVASYATGGS